jgi:hypothetical protein
VTPPRHVVVVKVELRREGAKCRFLERERVASLIKQGSTDQSDNTAKTCSHNKTRR